MQEKKNNRQSWNNKISNKKSQIKRTKINFVFQNKFQTISHSHSLFICKFKSYFVFEIDRNKRRNKKKLRNNKLIINNKKLNKTRNNNTMAIK